MKKDVREFLRKIGSKGGKAASHTLTSEQARKMVQAREKKRKAKKGAR